MEIGIGIKKENYTEIMINQPSLNIVAGWSGGKMVIDTERMINQQLLHLMAN